MPDLTTVAGIKAELIATAGYDVENDVALARRRVVALRAKIDTFPSSSGRGEHNVTIDQLRTENQLQQVITWLSANTPASEAQQLNDPSVVHADFSTFRGYC